MSKFNHMISRAYNRPLLLEPNSAQFMFAYLNSRMGYAGLMTHEGTELNADQCKAKADSFSPSRVRGSYDVQGNIAIIPIDGKLVHKSGTIDAESGIRGYDGISAMLNDAIQNPVVKGILLDADSGGGEVAGVQAAATKIIQANSIKPVWAHANEMAASAAYWLASSASKLFLSETASVGSIGVLTAHTDVSAAMAEAGYKVTLIYSGAHKVDGNPYEPLPSPIKDELQAEIDNLRQLFAKTVGINRNMSTDVVLNTEARMYTGQDAVDVGLADKVQSFSTTLAEMQVFVKNASNGLPNGGLLMSANTEQPVDNAGVITQAQVDQAKAKATADERERCLAIFGSEEAKGREATALKLAAMEMSAKDAIGILADVPKAEKPSANSAMLHGMAQGAGVAADAVVTQSDKNAIDQGFDRVMATITQGAKK